MGDWGWEVTHEAKLIGGPADGQFVRVSTGQDFYNWPVFPEISADWTKYGPVLPSDMHIPFVVYRRTRTGDFVFQEPRP